MRPDDQPNRPPNPPEHVKTPGAGEKPSRPADASGPLRDLVSDLRSLPFDTLFPIRQWWAEQPWRHRSVQAIVFFALFPLALSQVLGNEATIQSAAWALGGYFALLWGYVLWLIVQPGPLRFQTITIISAFTAIIGVALVLLLQQFPILSGLYGATEWNFSLARLIGFVLGVGLTEEAVKLLPVFWLAVKAMQIRTPREAAFYAGISGLAFGVAEAVSYSLFYTRLNLVGTMYGFVGSGDYVLNQTLRLISLPFLHCVFSAVAGYYLGLSLLVPARRTALLILGLALAATLHGLYNFFAGSWLSIATAVVAILMFVGYMRSAEQITRRLVEEHQSNS